MVRLEKAWCTIFFISLIACASLLTGCQTVKTAPTPSIEPSSQMPSWESRKQALSQIVNWQLNGKIAVQTAQDSGSALVAWAKRAGSYNVSLTGPLGAHGLTLIGEPGHVTLETGDGKRFTADNPEQLLAKQWGFNLPVSNLNYWVRGLPVPGIPFDGQFDAENRLTQFTQQGFDIRYSAYTEHGQFDLPSKMTITSSTLKTKLIIYKWKI